MFLETPIHLRASLCVRTGAIRLFAPVEYPRSRHLDTPTHKNSLTVSEKTSSRLLMSKLAVPAAFIFSRDALDTYAR